MPKAIENPNDIVNRKFGRLTVDAYIGRRVSGRNGYHMYLCHCDCGTQHVEVARRNLLRGDTKSCGCLHQKVGQDNKEDLMGQQFGRWRVIGPAPRKVSESGKARRTMWMCQCECGTVKAVGARALKTGMSTSCGCLQKERVSEALTDDLTGREFGYLTVIRRNGSWRSKGNQRGGIRAVWHCRCKCGAECDVTGELLKNGDITSCGCKKSSKYELYVAEYLDSLGYVLGQDYFKEKTYPGLVGLGGGALRFDFLFAPTGRAPILIECQGEQHKRVTKWYGGQEYFDRLQVHDQLKRQFAEDNHIRLVEMPHTMTTRELVSQFLENIGIS